MIQTLRSPGCRFHAGAAPLQRIFHIDAQSASSLPIFIRLNANWLKMIEPTGR